MTEKRIWEAALTWYVAERGFSGLTARMNSVPGRRFDNRRSPAIRPHQVALLHAEDQQSRVGAMSQRIHTVRLTCYEDQEILCWWACPWN
jgi:hypothetical protein